MYRREQVLGAVFQAFWVADEWKLPTNWLRTSWRSLHLLLFFFWWQFRVPGRKCEFGRKQEREVFWECEDWRITSALDAFVLLSRLTSSVIWTIKDLKDNFYTVPLCFRKPLPEYGSDYKKNGSWDVFFICFHFVMCCKVCKNKILWNSYPKNTTYTIGYTHKLGWTQVSFFTYFLIRTLINASNGEDTLIEGVSLTKRMIL